VRVVPVSSDDELVGEITFSPEDVIELVAYSGEYWGGFAEEAAPPNDPNIKGYQGAWYWRFWVWEPTAEITRGFGKNEEILEVPNDE
jgi:hypothetical protein